MTDDSREQGVDLAGLDDVLDEIEYPIDRERLLEEHGERELELPDGTTTLESVLGPIEQPEFDSAADVREAIFAGVGMDAVGRTRYTDRGAGVTSAEDEDQKSF